MSFLINSVALLCCWFGSVCAYAASERQTLLVNPLPKRPAWLAFCTTLVIAFTLLLTLHHWLAASLLLLVLVMLVWIAMALVVPYFKGQMTTVMLYGTGLTIMTALIGGFYVD